jgi:peptide/nickel transport system substrate-binding protein
MDSRRGQDVISYRDWIFHLSILLCSILAVSCTAGDGSTVGVSSTPTAVTLTIGYPHQTGQTLLHGAQQAARLLSFEGLTYLARDGRPQPKLAAGWTESPDGLTWTVRLRENAFFHDGSPVDANSVKESLDRSRNAVDRDRSPGLSDIVKVEVLSPTTLAVHVRDRSRFLLDDLTVAIVKQQSTGAVVGVGPFVTESISENELVMRGLPNYYRGKPTIDRIVWKSYPAVRGAWAAMMRGEIDFLYEVPQEAVEFIEAETSVRIFSFLRNYAYLVIFNSKREPFDDWRVRRSLNYAINRDTLIERALSKRGQVVSGPIWPLHWAYDAAVASYSYDPARATALLDAANIPRSVKPAGNSGAPGRIHFTCLVPETFALWERMALNVQRDLARVGVNMQIESVPFEVFNQRIGSGDFDAVIMELIVGNTASRPFTFWSSRSTQNSWGYKNTALDEALDDLRHAADDTQYRNAFRRVQVHSLEDPPAIFLALGQITRAVSNRFQVNAPPNTDILPSIPDWHLTDAPTREPD